MMLTGSTALSVESRINCSVRLFAAASTSTAGADCIVLDCRKGILFHERNMLVSSRVVHNLGTVAAEYLGQQCRVRDAAQYRHVLDRARQLLQSRVYFVQIPLRSFQ